MADLQLQISALCRARSHTLWEQEGTRGRTDSALWGELARDGNMRFCKVETLRRKTHTQTAPGQAAGGACLESISSPGRKGLLHTCTNAERPLQRGREDGCVLQMGSRSGWARLSPRLLAETDFCRNGSWH